ncbi:MAG: autoinducer binding domain-containing protein [Ideonella sp.]|nr:autoinducer binding domain-containing protein [Ideonella sp.]
MLQGSYASVQGARSREDFRDEVVRFAHSLGFTSVGAMLVIDRGIGRADFDGVHNAPPGYEEAMQDLQSVRRDPVLQHCRRQSVPIIWDQATYTEQGLGEMWEEQARFGYVNGIAMSLHLPEGRHFTLGVDRDRPLPRDRQELTRLVADLQLFAVYAQEAATRLLCPNVTEIVVPKLTLREVEVLQWTMEGKTAWEVGAILGISERTAVMHLNNAMHKLDAANKHHAVVKALKLGLIH